MADFVPTPVVARPGWTRVKWTRAGQVLALIGAVPGDADPDLPPERFLAAVRGSDPATGLRFMAQALPRIDAAVWMLACLEREERSGDGARAALKAVRRWVQQPSDEARRLAWAAGEAIRFDGMEGLACLAVFLSGGAMSPTAPPPGQQDIPVNPAPGAFGQAVAGAVMLAAHARGALAFPERAAALLDLAADAAAGVSR